MASEQKQLGISVAIWAAAIAVLGNAVSTLVTTENEQVLQARAFEAERILEAIKTGDPDVSAENLEFLLRARLITDPATVKGVVGYLTSRERGEGVYLPTEGLTTDPTDIKDSARTLSEQDGNILLQQFGIMPDDEIRPLTPRWVTRDTGNAR